MALKLSRLVKGQVRAETVNGTEHTPFTGWNNLQNGPNRSDDPRQWVAGRNGIPDMPEDGGRGVDRKPRRNWGCW
jgi:hypothetical protein